MSCWFARSVYEVLKAKFGRRQEATRHASDRGTYMGKTLVPDDLCFDLSQLSSGVLRESVIRTYPQRIGWLWNTYLEEERATLDHVCPEVFALAVSASSPACPGRQACIRPVEELIEGLDNTYVAKIRDIRIAVENCQSDPVRKSMKLVRELEKVIKRVGEECRMIDEAEQGMREGSPGADEAAQRSREALRGPQGVARRLAEEAQGSQEEREMGQETKHSRGGLDG